MASDATISRGGGVLKYVVSPFVLILPIILVTGLSGDFQFSANAEFIVGVAAIYIMLSGFYMILCRRGKDIAAIAVACVTNGITLLFFSSAFNAGLLLSFSGFLVAIVGIAVGMTVTAPAGEPLFARKIDRIMPGGAGIEDLQKIIDAIQFPCIFMERGEDGFEKIVAYNPQFAEDFGLDKKKILGSSPDTLINFERGAERLMFAGVEWTVKRTVRGRQILVMFSQVLKSREAAKIEVFDAIDAATGLYSTGFMKYKAKSDVESVNRGKRKMYVVFFRLSFPPDIAISLTEEERKLAGVILGRVVVQAIRACDSAYRISDSEVLLMMPDTPNSGWKIVESRIFNGMKRAAAVECPFLSKAVLDYVDRDYVGGIDLPSHENILDELSVLLYRKYPEIVSGA